MVQLSILNGFILNRLPLGAEEPIIKINRSLSNQLITKQEIIIKDLDNNVRIARELTLHLIHLVEFGVWLVNLVVVLLVENLGATFYVRVGITVRSDVTLSHVVTFQKVQANRRLSECH